MTVEPYWPGLFAKLFEKRSIGDLITNVGAGKHWNVFINFLAALLTAATGLAGWLTWRINPSWVCPLLSSRTGWSSHA